MITQDGEKGWEIALRETSKLREEEKKKKKAVGEGKW